MTVVEYVKPLTIKQVNDLREKLKELQAQKGTAKLRSRPPRSGRSSPASTGTPTLRLPRRSLSVTVAPDAEPAGKSCVCVRRSG
jgi:hypothetical protein